MWLSLPRNLLPHILIHWLACVTRPSERNQSGIWQFQTSIEARFKRYWPLRNQQPELTVPGCRVEFTYRSSFLHSSRATRVDTRCD